MERCNHEKLWRARDGWWYCESCDPPAFEREVVERSEAQYVLFDADRYAWQRKPVTSAA